jgi:hypothetical protein
MGYHLTPRAHKILIGAAVAPVAVAVSLSLWGHPSQDTPALVTASAPTAEPLVMLPQDVPVVPPEDRAKKAPACKITTATKDQTSTKNSTTTNKTTGKVTNSTTTSTTSTITTTTTCPSKAQGSHHGFITYEVIRTIVR